MGVVADTAIHKLSPHNRLRLCTSARLILRLLRTFGEFLCGGRLRILITLAQKRFNLRQPPPAWQTLDSYLRGFRLVSSRLSKVDSLPKRDLQPNAIRQTRLCASFPRPPLSAPL